MIYNVILDLSHLNFFGFMSFTTTSGVKKTKVSSRARKCVFLNYNKGSTLFIRDMIYHLTKNKIFQLD